MATSKPKANWTDAEKIGLLYQIIEKSGAIPWDQLKLPEGRTKKACMVMVDKEKQKVKKALEAEAGERGGDGETEGGDDGEVEKAAEPKTKRKATSEAAPKKPEAPRKKKAKAEEECEKPADEEAPVKGEEDDELA
ncbi:hypothetical protein LTR37_012865 [Vermiconidia calcicola]|uniref:Uncharacterized protein n=1 Tax=Vermiconidia calcicola TaxID=1690605 RepID=A0ACC3MXZ0_9PEZI|nr:hypothetical protein LTR37_012865 [Vermiconidia calcicola]